MADLAKRTEIAARSPGALPAPGRGAPGRADPEVARRIYVFERAAQLEMLTTLKDAFLWEAPCPRRC